MREVDAVAQPREEVVPAGLSFALIRWIDAVNDRVGRAASWLTLLMVIITTYDVVMRYLFRTSFVFIQELEWHLFAILFLVVAGYTHLKGDHVRVDIFYARTSPRKRAWIDLVCSVLFLFPTVFLLVWTSIPFVINSIAVLEGSPDPGGIPGRFVLKAMIPFGFVLVGLQGISETLKNLLRLAGKDVVIGKETPK
ncbi:MAG: TRAP transporter small permease subunit [Candidatus Rokubacteria bacterium]|nr:TRAP transporter small permease subunit [Candidatus Rokubacteria bacterium]